MRTFIATLIYLYSLITCAGTLVVQSHAVTDIYGSELALNAGYKDVVFLDRVMRPQDVTHAINSFTLAEKYTDVILLGPTLAIDNSRRYPVLTMFQLNKVIAGNVYVLQGKGTLESARLATIKEQVEVTEVLQVQTEQDLRKAMLVLNRKEKGFLIINAFYLRDNWNKYLTFPAIEKLVVGLNKTHVDVGICREGFQSALAVGPTSTEAALVLRGVKSTSICASLERLKKLGSMELYDQLTGTFYRVTSNKR